MDSDQFAKTHPQPPPPEYTSEAEMEPEGVWTLPDKKSVNFAKNPTGPGRSKIQKEGNGQKQVKSTCPKNVPILAIVAFDFAIGLTLLGLTVVFHYSFYDILAVTPLRASLLFASAFGPPGNASLANDFRRNATGTLGRATASRSRDETPKQQGSDNFHSATGSIQQLARQKRNFFPPPPVMSHPWQEPEPFFQFQPMGGPGPATGPSFMQQKNIPPFQQPNFNENPFNNFQQSNNWHQSTSVRYRDRSRGFPRYNKAHQRPTYVKSVKNAWMWKPFQESALLDFRSAARRNEFMQKLRQPLATTAPAQMPPVAPKFWEGLKIKKLKSADQQRPWPKMEVSEESSESSEFEISSQAYMQRSPTMYTESRAQKEPRFRTSNQENFQFPRNDEEDAQLQTDTEEKSRLPNFSPGFPHMGSVQMHPVGQSLAFRDLRPNPAQHNPHVHATLETPRPTVPNVDFPQHFGKVGARNRGFSNYVASLLVLYFILLAMLPIVVLNFYLTPHASPVIIVSRLSAGILTVLLELTALLLIDSVAGVTMGPQANSLFSDNGAYTWMSSVILGLQVCLTGSILSGILGVFLAGRCFLERAADQGPEPGLENGKQVEKH